MVEILHSAFFDYIHAELHKLFNVVAERARSAVMPCSFKWAEISVSEIGWASSVVSQKYLNRMSVRFVSAMVPPFCICTIGLIVVLFISKSD